VVVATIGVAGYAAVIFFKGGLFVVVIHSQRDDAFGLRKEFEDIFTKLFFLHVSHASFVTFFQPSVESEKMFGLETC